MSLIVRLGGIRFLGDGPLTDGWHINADGWRGWNDGTPIHRDETEREQAGGAFDAPGYGGPRKVFIEGWVQTSTENLLSLEKGKFNSLQAREPLAIYVEELGERLYAPEVRVTGTPTFDVWGGQRWADFRLQLWIADQRKFGETHTAGPGTTVVAYHRGSVAASSIITVTATTTMAAGYTIEGPDGKEYTVTTPVTVGHPHVIDMNDGHLTIDGVLTGGITQGDTWAIPGGTAVSHTLVPGTGTGTLTIATKDTH